MPPAIKQLWQHRYNEYLADSSLLYAEEADEEEKKIKFQELYEKYKHVSVLYSFEYQLFFS